MTARVLVVDDVESNLKLLDAWLRHDYFHVVTATNGEDALKLAESEAPDVILLDVMMPGMDGFEVCRKLKQNPRTEHIPIILVTALDAPTDKVAGLEAGADDFLAKPVDNTSLIVRIRALTRYKMVIDELRLREETDSAFGVNWDWCRSTQEALENARALLIDDSDLNAVFMKNALSSKLTLVHASSPDEASTRYGSEEFDVIFVNLASNGFDGLRACGEIRARESWRYAPVLVMDKKSERNELIRAFDLGASDFILQDIDQAELIARTRTHIRRKKFSDWLRRDLRQNLRMSATDALTGLYNRRYMERHLMALMERSREANKEFSVLFLDIDHFKRINDQFGHDAGDSVLREVSEVLLTNLRGIDLPTRYGGEEFVIILPDTSVQEAQTVADRLLEAFRNKSFTIPDSEDEIKITVSIGIAGTGGSASSVDNIIKQADRALYNAKKAGRNQIAVSDQ